MQGKDTRCRRAASEFSRQGEGRGRGPSEGTVQNPRPLQVHLAPVQTSLKGCPGIGSHTHEGLSSEHPWVTNFTEESDLAPGIQLRRPSIQMSESTGDLYSNHNTRHLLTGSEYSCLQRMDSNNHQALHGVSSLTTYHLKQHNSRLTVLEARQPRCPQT